MGKEILNEKELELFGSIQGFTSLLENAIQSRKRSKEPINLDNITNMPTYEFVTLALQSNSPRQVITAIEAVRKRYLLKFNFDRDVMGFLDSIEGKAYGYMAMHIQNLKKQEKLYNLACKFFNSAISKGYVNANVDLADLQEKLESRHKADSTLRYLKYDLPDAHRKMGELHFNFSNLVENAIRVLQGRRPFIEDETALALAIYHFEKGEDSSVECRLYKGLALIISGEDKKGMELVKDNIKEFKEKNKDINKILFASDAQIFKDNISLIENKLLKLNIR